MVKTLKELSNVAIDRALATSPSYGGCYSKDKLPSPPLPSKFYVVNMQNEQAGGGTHWVLLDNRNPHTVNYFDSMGEVPPTSVKRLMASTGKKKAINRFELQPMGTDSCGWWCIAAAAAAEEGKTMSDFISMFDLDTPTHNEKLLASMFSS